MMQLTKTIGKVRKQINPILKIDGEVLTLVAKNTNLAKTAEATLREICLCCYKNDRLIFYFTRTVKNIGFLGFRRGFSVPMYFYIDCT